MLSARSRSAAPGCRARPGTRRSARPRRLELTDSGAPATRKISFSWRPSTRRRRTRNAAGRSPPPRPGRQNRRMGVMMLRSPALSGGRAGAAETKRPTSLWRGGAGGSVDAGRPLAGLRDGREVGAPTTFGFVGSGQGSSAAARRSPSPPWAAADTASVTRAGLRRRPVDRAPAGAGGRRAGMGALGRRPAPPGLRLLRGGGPCRTAAGAAVVGVGAEQPGRRRHAAPPGRSASPAANR